MSHLSQDLPPPSPARPPDRVGPYRFQSKLGEGGMGEVYRAWDERLERPVAIKKILPKNAADKKARNRFRREARAVARLNHPAVVQIFDVLETAEGEWLVMEFIEGESIKDLLRRGPFDLPRVLELGRQVADGLAAAHQEQIIHRDLKSENVMLTSRGQAKILDFGLAKVYGAGIHGSGSHSLEESPQLSIEGMVVGTSRVMSPEQAMGLDLEPRSDLFSLGVLLYEMATGESPFLGNNALVTMNRICNHRQQPVHEARPEIPPALSHLIDRLLAKRPRNRPPNAATVCAALAAIQAEATLPEELDHLTEPFADGDVPLGEHLSDLPDVSEGRPAAPLPRVSSSTSTLPHSTVIHTLLALQPILDDGTSSAEGVGEDAARLLAAGAKKARELLTRFGGYELDTALDDGLLMLFSRPADAVGFALACRGAVIKLGDELGAGLPDTPRPTIRAAIHLGEVEVHESSPGDASRGLPLIASRGPTRDITLKALRRAQPGQVLATRGVYELVRWAPHEDSSREQQALRWDGAGEPMLPGIGQTVQLFAVDVADAHGLGAATGTASRVPGSTRIRSSFWGPLTVIAALIVLIFAAVRWLPENDDAERPTIAVLGFKNLSQNQELDWMSTALSEMLSTELAVSGDLRMISGESVARMRQDLELAAVDSLAVDTLGRIREYIQADFVVLGSFLIFEQGGQRTMQLQVHLQATADGGRETFRESGTASELFELVSSSGQAVRQELGLGQLSEPQVAVARAAVSDDSEATRLYSRGLDLLRSHRLLAARDALLQAVESDPNYALAHVALSTAWSALGYEKEALESAEEAFDLARRGELPREEALMIEARYHETAGEWEEAIATHDSLWRFYPDNVEYGLRLAAAQTASGHGQAALETLAEMRQEQKRHDKGAAMSDPRLDLAMAMAYAKLEMHNETIDATARAIRRGTEQEARTLVAEALMLQAEAQRQQGEPKEALAALQQARKLFEESGDRGKIAEVLTSISKVYQFDDDSVRVNLLLREALTIYEEIGNRRGMAQTFNLLAFQAQSAGDLEAARAMLEDAVSQAREVGDRHGETENLDTLAWVLVQLAQLEATRDVVAQERRLATELDNHSKLIWCDLTLGQVALAEGDVREAKKVMQRARRRLERSDFRLLEGWVGSVSAETALAADELTAAEAHLAEVQEAWEDYSSEYYLAEAQLLRARILEARGDPAAESTIRQARAEFLRRSKVDSAAIATAVQMRILTAAGRTAEASGLLPALEGRAALTQMPRVRIEAALAGGRWRAASGETGEARQRLLTALDEAEKLGLRWLALELELALGEIALAEPATAAAGRERLSRVIDQAEGTGLHYVARRAREALAP